MSGDANTSIGNSIINYLILRWCFPESTIMVNGDDSIIFGGYQEHDLALTGMKSTISKAHTLDEIEFCQLRFVQFGETCAAMRDPHRVLSRMAIKCTTAPPNRDWYYTLGQGEMHASPYDPFVQRLARSFDRHGKKGRFRRHLLEYRHGVLATSEVHRETIESTKAWSRVFRIDPEIAASLFRFAEQLCCNV